MVIGAPMRLIIDGNSSSGKSSVARALQQIMAQSDVCVAHLGFDEWMRQLPDSWVNIDSQDPNQTKEDGLQFIRDESGAVSRIQMGPIVSDFRKALFECSKILPGQWILEGCLMPEEVQASRSIFHGMGCKWIQLNCELDVLEQREKERNGFIGLSRTLEKLNQQKDPSRYDLVLDTTRLDPTQIAKQIKKFSNQDL